MDFLSFVRDHFSHAAPILAAGILAIAIVIERVKTLFVDYAFKDSKEFFEQISKLVLSGQTPQAIEHCQKYAKAPASSVVKAGLVRSHLPAELVEYGVQLAISEGSQNITKRTAFLATIANVATLLGLFGTILGLIGSFQAVGSADPQQKSALLAAGISTAMNATMLGLGVAIPCMVAFSFLINKAQKMTHDLETAGIRVVDILKQRYYVQDNLNETNSAPQNINGAA